MLISKLKKYSQTQLPTTHGLFDCIVFRDEQNLEHVAMIKGNIDVEQSILCRIHSECLTGEVLGSLKCDCKNQLDFALDKIQKRGEGVLLYLRQEGRGIGLGNKIKAYALQEKGADTVDANLILGFSEDAREYDIAADMLLMLGITSIELMTNNPKKISAIEGAGIKVKHEPLQIKSLPDQAEAYLNVKRDRMGHLINRCDLEFS
jgi:GTP cyclohydrolase II